MNVFAIQPRTKEGNCGIQTGEFAGELFLNANPKWATAWLAANKEPVSAPLFIFGPKDRKRGDYNKCGSVWWDKSFAHVGSFKNGDKSYNVTIEILDAKTYEGTITFTELMAPPEDALAVAAAA